MDLKLREKKTKRKIDKKKKDKKTKWQKKEEKITKIQNDKKTKMNIWKDKKAKKDKRPKKEFNIVMSGQFPNVAIFSIRWPLPLGSSTPSCSLAGGKFHHRARPLKPAGEC